ncbi:MAG: transposase [Xanthobacteraceae bacterium]
MGGLHQIGRRLTWAFELWSDAAITGTINRAAPPQQGSEATGLVASVADPKTFRSGRDFLACIGLVPKHDSSRGKDGLGRPSATPTRRLGARLRPYSRSERNWNDSVVLAVHTSTGAVTLLARKPDRRNCPCTSRRFHARV